MRETRQEKIKAKTAARYIYSLFSMYYVPCKNHILETSEVNGLFVRIKGCRTGMLHSSLQGGSALKLVKAQPNDQACPGKNSLSQIYQTKNTKGADNKDLNALTKGR